MTNIFQKSIIKLSNYKLVSDAKKAHKRLDRITFTPMETQEQFLLQILRDNIPTKLRVEEDSSGSHIVRDVG